jgi:hypothetical protein
MFVLACKESHIDRCQEIAGFLQQDFSSQNPKFQTDYMNILSVSPDLSVLNVCQELVAISNTPTGILSINFVV